MAAWVHRCPWCGWSRDGESATMLEPRCESCGGLLESLPSAQATAVGDRGDHPLADAFSRSRPTLSPAFGRMLRFALLGLLLFSAARFGWSAGGAGLAIAAVGVVGLFTVPLIVGE